MVTLGEQARTVLVLGAGFTHAFVPEAPLLIGDFGAKLLARKFQKFPHATRVLDAETGGRSGREMNIERLMTRLDGRMPYDSQHGAQSELSLLLKMLKEHFVRRVTDARENRTQDDDFERLAKCCVENAISCVTFNYDDVFDQTLWEAQRLTFVPPPGTKYWHPDGGYGFFCRGSFMAIRETGLSMDRTSMLLLKLHGSLNWRTKLGTRQPHSIDNIVHHEDWMPIAAVAELTEFDVPAIERHLNPDPLIVPPVLVKSNLVDEPVLQLVWSLAYKELEKAERVIFIGYSFPVTDMAARFLFSETLLRTKERPEIKVVNLKRTADEKEGLMRAYREVFPHIHDDQFDFRDARDWSRDFISAATDSEAVSG